MLVEEVISVWLLASSTWTLRATTIYFLRFLPLGDRFLSAIYYNYLLYIVLFLYVVYQHRKHARVQSQRSPFAIIFFGLYDSSAILASLCGFVVNLLCLLATVDFVYRAQLLHNETDLVFSRMGYVDDNSARITVRAPDKSIVSMEYQSIDDIEWQQGRALEYDEKTYDGVLTFALLSLQPAKEYRYRTNASHSGTFRTRVSHPKRFSLVSSSCIKPFYPYHPLDHSLRIPGLEHLARFVKEKQIDFILFLGDFIYIDLPTRFGWSTSDYQKAYRQVYASPSWSEELLSIPWLHIYDDHEITNDWDSNTTGLYQRAISPYMAYHHWANPVPSDRNDTFYIFNWGDISFFVADTRRYRSPEDMPDGPGKSMLGEEQLNLLMQWLNTEKRWKVFVTSVPFTRNWRGPESKDSWSGYMFERQRVLDLMSETEGVVILSGDRHEHATTAFPGTDGSVKVIEFSTSPLSQFYQPFDRKYQQIEITDAEIYSHPFGISKFGVLTFDTSSKDHLTVEFELIVDGKSTWKYTWTI